MDPYIPRRLHKFLVDAQVGSRREVVRICEAGRVTYDGADPAHHFPLVWPPSNVRVDGRVVAPLEPTRYALFHKPPGVLSALAHPSRRHVGHFLPHGWRGRVGLVGRLDAPTTGGIVVTDDGDLNYMLTHSKHSVWKTYELTLKGRVPEDHPGLTAMGEGMTLSDGPTLPGRVQWMGSDGEQTLVRLSIREGRNRQVRRMAKGQGFYLVHLHRIRVGALHLGALAQGAYRLLEPAEVQALFALGGGSRLPGHRAIQAMIRRRDEGHLAPSEVAVVDAYLKRSPKLVAEALGCACRQATECSP